MFFFTADEHYFHINIIEYCGRPYGSIEEMNNDLIARHNSVVGKDDVVVHAGDFSFGTKAETAEVIRQLNGNHVFLKGCHDWWLQGKSRYIWKKTLEGKVVVVSHYPMRSWYASYYGSWNLHGHSHGKLEPLKNQYDVGVDNNSFYPVSFPRIKELLSEG